MLAGADAAASAACRNAATVAMVCFVVFGWTDTNFSEEALALSTTNTSTKSSELLSGTNTVVPQHNNEYADLYR